MPAEDVPVPSPPPGDGYRAAFCAFALAAAKSGNALALRGAVEEGGVDHDGVRDADGNTPLLVAAACGHTECVMLLLQAGADSGATNLRGEGLLQACFANGHTSLGTAVAAWQRDAAGGSQSDWAACADEHGVDTEAIIAALELGLDLRMFETPKAREREQRAGPARSSSSARFLEDVEESILSTELNFREDDKRSRGGSGRPANVSRLQLPGHHVDSSNSDRATSPTSPGSQRPAPPVPGLQLPVRGESASDADMSSGERELTEAALEARRAEAELYMAAHLGQPVDDAKQGRKKREKIRHKHRSEQESTGNAPAHKGAHVSESIVLVGMAQAAFESEQAKMTRAQQEASELDREIQEQLDEGLLKGAEVGDSKGIKVWLDRGACIDALQRHTRSSALHLAAAAGHRKACKVLLREGADLAVKNAQGDTAAEAAFRGGHEQLAQYLASKVDSVHSVDALESLESRPASVDALQSRPASAREEEPGGKVGNEECGQTSRASRAVEDGIKGLHTQLRRWDLTTFPQNLDSHNLCDSPGAGDLLGEGGEDLHGLSLSQTVAQEVLDDAEEVLDVLQCAEEFLQTVGPADGDFTGAPTLPFSLHALLLTLHLLQRVTTVSNE